MSFAQRFTLVMLAAFFLTNLATSIAALLLAPSVLRRCAREQISARAWGLALFRLLPAVAALAITLLVLVPGYYTHEQRSEPESGGLLLLLAAIAGALILLSAAARACQAVAHTASLRRSWLRTARPTSLPRCGFPAFELDLPFPLVAVLGAVRPRLFISRSVLRACTAAEIEAIVEHERAHVSCADNIVRLLMQASPDLLWRTSVARRVEAAWHHAVELRADGAAARPLDLASALVRVARLARTSDAVSLPASALYRGEGVEERVRRLTMSGDAVTISVVWRRRLAAVAVVLAVMLAVANMNDAASIVAHRLLEAAVSLP